ncbi:MAG: hypothetical protein C3F13_11070 [Anaerolineales bacterium]|nr:hypothetical protein [Anaerolineae bacterium]PWB52676.1 MAG: hypothetical protein C3F13_11070 [Anaerolineales bacterium]
MNYLVILDADAGELEKILSGVKSMVIKESKSADTSGMPLLLGDNLYFLRNNAERDIRVKATIKSIQVVSSGSAEDISHQLKEMQPKLQLTEAQFMYWCTKKQVLLVEFECAQKIGMIHLDLDEIKGQSDWIAFQAFSVLTSGMLQ